MLQATREQIATHYPADDQAWVSRLGTKSLGTFQENGLDPIDFLGTADPAEIGTKVLDYLINYMTRGPVVTMVVQ